jgi:DNA-binding transcriptional LysR family regulator
VRFGKGDWHEWAVAGGEAPLNQPLLRFDSLITVQNAVLAGAGVFLASAALARAPYQSGDLIKLSDRTLVMSAGYWLTWPRERILSGDDEAIISTLTGDS